MSEVVVSHRWIAQVLKQRGIPVPDIKVLEVAVAQCSEEIRARLLNAVTLIERGTEEAGDIEWVRGILKAPAQKARKVSPDHEHPPFVVSAAPVPPQATEPRLDRAQFQEKRRLAEVPGGTVVPVRRVKHHIYASKAALTIELDTLRQQPGEEDVVRTVLIEAAVTTSGSGYDWERKIPFQLMRRELPIVACALLGLLDRPLAIENHGPERNKSLRIEQQGSKLFVKVSQGSRSIALPVDCSDAYAWNAIVLQALQLNAPSLSDSLQLQLIHRVAEMMNHTPTK
ncbi:hypothetical protein [Polaromonas sp. AER18D-145]|uniref:hypothetical protein n=1 Tax=Polaromonas sp. AER18D-145 TaxID=1977060 RepID=UPI000BBBBE26|nr:hypothetical protein [Polaromonas sp. AER18D-145]